MRTSERADGHRLRALTLVEMLIAFISASVVLGAMGTLLMQTLNGYRNVRFIAGAGIGGATLDVRMRTILTSANVTQDPIGVPPRKAFTTTPSVGSGGTILKPRALAYVRVKNDFSTEVPPRVFSSQAERLTGIVYWYRANPTFGQTVFDEGTSYLESVIYWMEAPEASMSAMGQPRSFFTQFDDAQVLAFQNNVANRKSSAVLARNVAAFALDDSTPTSIQYRVEFLVAQ